MVHNGISLHKNAIESFREISKSNKEYVLLTNAPRPSKTVKSFLEKMGMNNKLEKKYIPQERQP